MTPSLFHLERIGADLPVATAVADIEAAATTGALVITAPPGTGKTTFVPPLLTNLVAPQRVILTAPRRVAVRAAAARIAALQGESVGQTVGFTVRGERRVSADTLLEIVTPGVLLRRLLTDPALEGVGAVILDEIHERSLDGDLLLGLLSEVTELRDDLTLVAMSATLMPDAVAKILGGAQSPAPIVNIPSPLYPLNISYAPGGSPRLDPRGVSRSALILAAEAAVAAQHDDGCDVLVFVPGVREVDAVISAVTARIDNAEPGLRSEVLPLHGRLRPAEQDRVVRGRKPGDPPRIVVSTALAESSITVPGVRTVVDLGLSREVRRDRARDMSGLVTVSASRASIDQRAGRAAREAPGRAIRLFAEADAAHMSASATPEIITADLLDAALLLSVWGTPRGDGLRLLTPPPAAEMDDAMTSLEVLGLIDTNGYATGLGAKLAQLPLGTREARALLEGARLISNAEQAGEIVAALASDSRAPDADLAALLRALRAGRSPGASAWRREAQRLARLGADAPLTVNDAPDSTAASHTDVHAEARIIALARPEWIARRTGAHSRSYLLASGTRAALPEESSLRDAEWLAVAEVQRTEGRAGDGTGAVIRLAARLSEAAAIAWGASLHRSHREARVIDDRVQVRAVETLGAISLSARPVSAEATEIVDTSLSYLRERGLAPLNWTPQATTLRRRLALLHRVLGAPWPDVSDAALLSAHASWLDSALSALRPGDPLSAFDTAAALRALLPWPEATQFDQLAPERFRVPSGTHAHITYPPDDDPHARPVIAVKLQEVFGLSDTPSLVEGRVPVLIHLLSPAGRPLAITDDLPSFWSGPYQQVRREMRGRYPKHPWPEDPWTAQATARTTRRPSKP